MHKLSTSIKWSSKWISNLLKNRKKKHDFFGQRWNYCGLLPAKKRKGGGEIPWKAGSPGEDVTYQSSEFPGDGTLSTFAFSPASIWYLKLILPLCELLACSTVCPSVFLSRRYGVVWILLHYSCRLWAGSWTIEPREGEARSTGEKERKKERKQPEERHGGRGSSFCLCHRDRRGFHFESSITVGDQSQLNSSDEDAAAWKKGTRIAEEDESKTGTLDVEQRRPATYVQRV